MKIVLPAVMALDSRQRVGTIRQMLQLSCAVEGAAVRYTLDKYIGLRFTSTDGLREVYLFATLPKGAVFSPETKVVVAKFSFDEEENLDASSGAWWCHPLLKVDSERAPATLAGSARKSWSGAFNFVAENNDEIGRAHV